MNERKSTTEARQGASGKHTVWVLAISTIAAAVIAIGAYIYVAGSDNEDLGGPIPEAEEAVQSEPERTE